MEGIRALNSNSLMEIVGFLVCADLTCDEEVVGVREDVLVVPVHEEESGVESLSVIGLWTVSVDVVTKTSFRVVVFWKTVCCLSLLDIRLMWTCRAFVSQDC